MIPSSPDTLLRRAAAANALTEAGYPTSAATLATKATRGGGPLFRLYGRVPLYRWGDAIAWAQGRTTLPRHTTGSRELSLRCDRKGQPAV